MRTTLVIFVLSVFSFVARAQSKVDSLIITYKNVNSVTSKTGAYVDDHNTEQIAADLHDLVITQINIRALNLLSLTSSDNKATRQVVIKYDSLSSSVSSITYNRMGGVPTTIVDSSFELLDLSMHRVGDHFHSEFHGTDVASHMNVTASGHHDGGSFGTYDQTVTFKATDSSTITIDLYANIFSRVNEQLQASASLTVYPSVASDRITLSLPENDSNTEILLCDALGRTIETYRFAEVTPQAIDLTALSQGMYFIRDSKGRSARFVVAR